MTSGIWITLILSVTAITLAIIWALAYIATDSDAQDMIARYFPKKKELEDKA